MDAKTVLQILKDYEERKINSSEASLDLVMAGCSTKECVLLLPPPPKLYYKVVHKLIGGSLVSCNMGDICYKVGEYVQPLPFWGPLSVFESVEDAKDFKFHCWDNMEEYEIYSCIIVPSSRRNLWTPTSTLAIQFLPNGTVFAEAVKLLELID